MVKKLQALRAKKGFTLVELIVVIAIIAVLAAILVPTMMGMVTKSRVTSNDSTASGLKDTVATWMVELDTAGLKVPSTATINITGHNGSWTLKDGADTTFANFGAGAKDKLEAKLDGDYDFTKDMIAIVYIVDRKAVAAVYSNDSSATLTGFTASVLRSGSYAWPSTDGVDANGVIIGTYPKCIKS